MLVNIYFDAIFVAGQLCALRTKLDLGYLETAMGRRIAAQSNGDAAYVRAVYK